MSAWARTALEAVSAPAWAAAQRLGRCDPRETVVIAGSPRSGTTLALEALKRLDGYKGANEPDMMKYAREHGFAHRTFMEPGARHARREAYLEAILAGQMPSKDVWRLDGDDALARSRELATSRKLVVKFCRINRMLQWFDDRFAFRRMIVVVRHPCAVVASMRRQGAWTDAMNAARAGRPLDLSDLPDTVRDRFAPLVADVASPEDAMTVAWCLDTYVPFVHHSRHPWYLLSYERLVRDREAEARRLSGALGMTLGPSVMAVLDRPSSSTTTALGRSPEAQLSKWKSDLAPAQVDRILSIVDRAGLSHLYGDAALPDDRALDALQDPRWRRVPDAAGAADVGARA